MKKIMLIFLMLVIVTSFINSGGTINVKAGNPVPPGAYPSPEDCYNPCSWPSYRGDNFNTAYQEPDCSPQCLDEKGALQLIWRQDTIGSTFFPPSLDFGRAYVCDGAGFTYCFDAFDGSIPPYWKIGTGSAICMAPALYCSQDGKNQYKKRIFYGDDFGNFYCRDAITGTLIWKDFVDNPIRCSPKIYKGRVYFATDCGQVYCYNADLATAQRFWMYDIGDAMIRATFAVGFDRLWFGASNNNLYCLDITVTPPVMAFGWPVTTGTYVESAPVYDSGNIYYCATNMYRYNAFVGGPPLSVNDQWNFITHPSIDMSNKNIYAGVSQNQNHILKLNTPDLTVAPGPTAIPVVYQRLTSPSTTNQTAFATSTDTNNANHSIYIYRSGVRDVVPVDAPKGETLSSIAIAYQNLYFCRDSCGVYCYGCRCEKTYTLTVIPEYVCLELNQNQYASFQFKALVFDEKGNLTPATISWSVSPISPNIMPAAISNTGVFSTSFKGKWKITATATIGSQNISGNAVVEVK